MNIQSRMNSGLRLESCHLLISPRRQAPAALLPSLLFLPRSCSQGRGYSTIGAERLEHFLSVTTSCFPPENRACSPTLKSKSFTQLHSHPPNAAHFDQDPTMAVISHNRMIIDSNIALYSTFADSLITHHRA